MGDNRRTHEISSSGPIINCENMAPKHAFLFDMPVRYVLGAGITTGVLWTFLRPKDVALAQEPEKKPKVLVRTASGAVVPCNQTVVPRRRAGHGAARHQYLSRNKPTHASSPVADSAGPCGLRARDGLCQAYGHGQVDPLALRWTR